ncbi:MAG: TolC family protein [Phycisphaerales bacterium]
MFLKNTQFSSIAFILLLQACTSPLSAPVARVSTATQKTTTTKTTQVNIRRTNDASNLDTQIQLPLQASTRVETALQHRAEELRILAPANTSGWESDTGINLHLAPSVPQPLSLQEAVFFSLENNLDIHLAVLQPQIAEQGIINTEAAFDFVFGAGVSKNRTRVPQQQILAPGGAPLNSGESSSDQFLSNASLVKKLYGGGTVTVSTNITKSESEASGFTYSPDPAWKTIGTLELNQPLLRNFGEKITLAQVRLSKINKEQSDEDLRASLNSVVSLTEQSYLDLCLQWKKLQVALWLLEQGEDVVEILELRRSYDTSEADYAQAVATVQQRTAEIIKQQAAVQSASDTLKKLINTTAFSLDSEEVIQPVGELVASPLSISLRQALVTAVSNRPDLRKLSLQINANQVDIEVADNARLPQLDMQAQMSFYGLGDNANGGYTEVFGGDYVNYLVGLSFQIPLGNRSAEANFRSTRLKKMSAVASYKKGIQQATIEVKSALRNIVTNAALIQANKAFRIAQTENLRALTVEEETMAGLTPTFLNLKLQTQSGLAMARIAEIRAIVDYNKSISSLYQAMGTSLDQRQIKIDNAIK